jgi:hypothetical protein
MPLPTNPDFQYVGTSWATVDAISQANGGGNIAYGGTTQWELDQKIANLSGGPGSNINYIANGAPNQYNNTSGVNTVATTAATGPSGSGSVSGGSGGGSGKTSGIDKVLGAIGLGLGLIGAAKKIGAGIAEAQAGIAAAAGVASNLASSARAKALPKGGEIFIPTTKTSVLPVNDQDWRIRISSQVLQSTSEVFSPLTKTSGVAWPFVPRVTIGYKANYSQVEPIHSNFPFQAYKNSAVDDIQISGEFSVQTEQDADYWIAATHFLKTATKMFYGTGSGSLQGNPPVICRLNGYGSFIFNNIPVVIKSYSVEMPEDVNYINTSSNLINNQWVPAVSTISVTLAPVYNREKLRSFSLQDFAKGGELSRGIM